MAVSEYAPKYIVVRDRLRKMIADCKPGSKFYSDNELSEKLNISKHTIRRAMALLEQEGVLERRQGSGSFVKNGSRSVELKEIAILFHDLVDFKDPYCQSILESLSNSATDIGARSHLYPLSNHELGEDSDSLLGRMISKGDVDGVIAVSPLTEEATAFLMNTGVPFVMVDNQYIGAKFPQVLINDFKAVDMVFNHLVIERGHVNIGAVLLDTADDRNLGFEQMPAWVSRVNKIKDTIGLCVCKYDIPKPETSVAFLQEEAEGHRAAMELLGKKDRPSALFVSGGEKICLGVYRAVNELELGYGDLELTFFIDTPLKFKEISFQVIKPFKEVGKKAVELLRNIAAGEKDLPYRVIVDPVVVERPSEVLSSDIS